MNPNPVLKYFEVAAAYGAFRGIMRASTMKHTDGVTDALPAQKVGAVVSCVFFAPTFLPVYLYNDANRLYLTYTNGDFKKFGYEKIDRGIAQIIFE